MPVRKLNGIDIYYTDEGKGPETIVFSHGLLWSGTMFRAQVEAFKDRYRCITYDHRGQGKTPVTASGYDMDTLYGDAAALIESLGVARCHFVGLSMGGFVGMRLGARRPDLVKSLILMETSADPEPEENVPRYRKLAFVARWFGLKMVANQVMPIMFGKTFMNDPERADEREYWKQQMIANHKIGITRATYGVIDRVGVYDEIAGITIPTLIMVGDEDTATVPAKAERIHKQIKGSRLVIIPRAGHTSSVEEPETVNAALGAFLSEL